MSKRILKRIGLIVVLLIGIFWYGLLHHEVWTDMTPPEPTNAEIEQLISLVVQDGDTDSYDELSRVYCSKALPYSFYMANEHNYGKACHDVYKALMGPYSLRDKANNETAQLAISYLKKGAELGDFSCCSSLCTEYATGRYVPQDSVLVFHYAFLLKHDSVMALEYTQSALLVGKRVRKVGE